MIGRRGFGAVLLIMGIVFVLLSTRAGSSIGRASLWLSNAPFEVSPGTRRAALTVTSGTQRITRELPLDATLTPRGFIRIPLTGRVIVRRVRRESSRKRVRTGFESSGRSSPSARLPPRSISLERPRTPWESRSGCKSFWARSLSRYGLTRWPDPSSRPRRTSRSSDRSCSSSRRSCSASSRQMNSLRAPSVKASAFSQRLRNVRGLA